MRYKIRVTRVQTAERVIRATDEEAAVQKIQAELDKPYGFLGNWTNGGYEIEVVGEEPSLSGMPIAPAAVSSSLMAIQARPSRESRSR